MDEDLSLTSSMQYMYSMLSVKIFNFLHFAFPRPLKPNAHYSRNGQQRNTFSYRKLLWIIENDDGATHFFNALRCGAASTVLTSCMSLSICCSRRWLAAASSAVRWIMCISSGLKFHGRFICTVPSRGIFCTCTQQMVLKVIFK